MRYYVKIKGQRVNAVGRTDKECERDARKLAARYNGTVIAVPATR